MTSPELEALDPTPEVLKLESGLPVKIEELRLRQFIRMLKIVTRPVAQGLVDISDLSLSPDQDRDAFGARLAVILFTVIPEAENEFVDFLQSMVSPGNLIEKPVLEKSDVEFNKLRWAELDKELINPGLEDTVTLVEAIVRREAADIQSLGKRLMAMFKTARKMGQVPSSLEQIIPDESLSAASPEPVTPYSEPTDGPTSSATNSPSNQYEPSLQ